MSGTPASAERRAALVTGAGTGMGAAIARRLAHAGYDVCVNYRASEDAARAVARACGGASFACRGDVAEDGDCRGLVAQALARFGRLDALVNNAGITKFAPAHDLDALSAADWQRILATNVVGAFQMARAAAPALRASGAGSIVNMSSFAASAGFGSSIAYACSKGALNTLTIALARTLAPAVRVNAVCPSFVETRWVTTGLEPAEWAALKERAVAAAPLARAGTPEDVAETVAWLVTGARLVTGTLMATDAGMHLAHPLAPSQPATGERRVP